MSMVAEGEPPDEDRIVLKASGIDNLVNKVKPTNQPTEKDRKSEIKNMVLSCGSYKLLYFFSQCTYFVLKASMPNCMGGENVGWFSVLKTV